MKTKKPNAELVWKQIEDVLAPRLRLSITDRVVYSHLLRHSRLEGKLRLRFSIPWLSRGIGLCSNSTRSAVRRLISRGLLCLVQCGKAGRVVEVLLPEEILAASADRTDRTGGPVPPGFLPAIYSQGEDFLKTPALRRSIHARDLGRCFYCLRHLTSQTRCLDHVVPQSEFGGNCYRLLLSAMQFAKRRTLRPRLSSPALSRTSPKRRRTRRPPPHSRRRQTTASSCHVCQPPPQQKPPPSPPPCRFLVPRWRIRVRLFRECVPYFDPK